MFFFFFGGRVAGKLQVQDGERGHDSHNLIFI